MARKRSWRRLRGICLCCALGGSAAVSVFGFLSAAHGEREACLPVREHAAPLPGETRVGEGAGPLRVLTLNLAHGRSDGPNQVFQRGQSIQANLDEIAALLRREQPDLVGVQEADGPSLWSGRFDHVAYLAEQADFSYSVRGDQVQAQHLAYGTGLISQERLTNPRSFTFQPSPPSFSKGFVLAALDWPGAPGVQVDVVSLHLDFSRSRVRTRQVCELIEVLEPRPYPRIVMGDFNGEWDDPGSPVRTLAEGLGLQAYAPEAPDLETFPLLNTRLDYVLLSPELEFQSYRTLPDHVSDHRGVLCEVRWRL